MRRVVALVAAGHTGAAGASPLRAKIQAGSSSAATTDLGLRHLAAEATLRGVNAQVGDEVLHAGVGVRGRLGDGYPPWGGAKVWRLWQGR